MTTEKRKVISRKNFPVYPPIWQTAIVWLLLRETDASDWTQGAVWVVIGTLWLAFFLAVAQQDPVDVFEGGKQ